MGNSRLFKMVLTTLMVISLGFWGCEEGEENALDELVGTWYFTQEAEHYVYTTNSDQTLISTVSNTDGITVTGDANVTLDTWYFYSYDPSYYIYAYNWSDYVDYDLDITIASYDTSADFTISTYTRDYVTYYCEDPNFTWNPATLTFTLGTSVFYTSDSSGSVTISGTLMGVIIDIPADTPTEVPSDYEWETEYFSLTLNDDGTYETSDYDAGNWDIVGDIVVFDDEEYNYTLADGELTLFFEVDYCEGDTDCLEWIEWEHDFDEGSLSEVLYYYEMVFSNSAPSTAKIIAGSSGKLSRHVPVIQKNN